MNQPAQQSQLFQGKYPRGVAEFDDLAALIEKYVLPGFVPEQPIITKSDLVLTQGSCFAQNISAALKKNEFNAKTFHFQEGANSPKANEYFFKYLCNPEQPFENPDHASLFSTSRTVDFRSLYQKTKVYIFTLGVAPYIATRKDGAPVFDVRDIDTGDYCMANPTVEDVKCSITNIVSSVRGMNPDIKIVLTVSPVPLNRSAQPSSVVADCISKTTLRAAVAEYLRSAPDDIYYWPSFEIVRWLGAHLPPVFGADDGLSRHVNQNIIDLIVKLFLKYYAGVENTGR